MAIQFTDENVNDYIASSRPTLIDCWATWCGPCVRMSPIIDEVAAEFGDKANIGKYNVDEESDLSQQFRIMSIPTILFSKMANSSTDWPAPSLKRHLSTS